MLKGLLSVFDDREVSFFILVLSDFDPAEKCVFVLSFDKGNSSLYLALFAKELSLSKVVFIALVFVLS